MRREIVGDVERGAPWLQWGVMEHTKGRRGRFAVDDGKIIIEILAAVVRVIVSSPTGFICHPRTGDFVPLPIYTLSGNIIPTYAVRGGGWYPVGDAGTPGPGTSPPPNDPDTINNPDGSCLYGPDNLPLRF